MAIEVLKRRFTVEEYYRMAEAGILSERDRVELIEGEVVKMTPIGSRHAACVDRLTHLFSGRMKQRAIVRVQNPIRLGEHSEPQPDVALLKPRADFYAQAHPGPGDVLWLVEVAETSMEYDRTVKLPLYLDAGVPEVWLVNLAQACVDVYSSPSGAETSRRFQRGDDISPQSLPDLNFKVDDILG